MGPIGGYHMPMLIYFVMICEFSQLFINLRNTLGDCLTGTLDLINNVIFFLTYTFCRILLFPLIMASTWNRQRNYDFLNAKGTNSIGLVTKICYIGTLFFFVLVYFLNLFWYYLIVKKIIRIANGSDSKSDKNKVKES